MGCGRKITRRQVLKEDLGATCERILQPEVPLALRLSAVLMSGVVLLHGRKVQLFVDDVQERVRALIITYNNKDFHNVMQKIFLPFPPSLEGLESSRGLAASSGLAPRATAASKNPATSLSSASTRTFAFFRPNSSLRS